MTESEVFITNTAAFLPNHAVDNDHIEDYLGLIGGKPSRVKNIILRQNGIKKRYYALNTNQQITHTNAEITANAINSLFDREVNLNSIELLSCGTSVPDQLLPSHTAMVHGLLKTKAIDIISPAGVCAAGAHAIKVGYMSVKSGCSRNAVCTGSEQTSGFLLSKNFDAEYEALSQIEQNPMIAFEKDFLRFMLSDGSGAFLLENKPRGNKSLRIEWIDSISYANREGVCMYMGGEKREDGELKSWKQFTQDEWLSRSVFSIKQDVRLLDSKVVDYCTEHIKLCCEKYKFNPSEVNYFIPHLSSMIFKEKLRKSMDEKQLNIPLENWFTNLEWVGNVGSASIYIALDELFHSGKLKQGEKILLMIPESGRFSYVLVYLTVV
ncbi:MAG: beta-ketoacyl-ACP synthase III [Prevotellaceae bacterium]|jgi:3-oxoacyl-[acyl-carrier-protein] synthase-3|nr:beta-ketoacyl-ACP synthase III [Prevotellaceae bacterium]